MQQIVLKCWKSPFYQFLLFSIVTFITIVFMGYHFGVFDQSSHIPFLKKFADSTIYPNDHYFDLRFTHYSFFWFFFIPFYKLGILEISMFIVHIFATYLTFYAIWKLSKTLFNNPLVSFLSVIVFIFPHIGFGLETLFEFTLLNRTFVLPFLILSIDLYLNRKYFFAFLLLGIMFNLHVLSVNFVLAMFLFDSILRYKKIGWKKICVSVLLFFVTALPVLIWKSRVSPLDISMRPEWFSIISKGFLYHLFALFPKDPKLFILTLGGIGTVLMFYIGIYRSPQSEHNLTIKHFITAALIIIAVSFITSQWLPITIIIQSQIIRVSIFIILFAYLYFIHFLVSSYTNKEKQDSYRILLHYIIILLSGSPLVIPIIWFVQNRFRSIHLLKILTGISIVVFIGFLVFASLLHIWSPGIHIFVQKDSNYDVQMWARTHTLKNALFITPPYPWLFFDLEWRVVSERSTLTDLGELGEMAFSPEYVPYWKERFESIAPGALNEFKGNVFENKDIVRKAFYSLSTRDIKAVAQKYGATFLVAEKPHLYDFPLEYENGTYRVYKITQ